MAPRLRPRFAIVALLLLAVAIMLAAASFWPIHRSPALFVAVGVALAAGIGIGVLGALRRWPAWAVGATTIAAYLLLGVPAAVPGEAAYGVLPTVRGLGDLVAGSALSWKELLTISLPVGSYQTLLIPAFLSTLVGTVVAVSVALRARFGELGAIPPVVLFLIGILFGPTLVSSPLPVALGLLATLLAYVIWFRARRRAASLADLAAQTGTVVERGSDPSAAGLRRFLGAVVILVLAVSGAVVAQRLAPVGPDRVVLRSAIEVPFDPNDYASPLSSFRRYFQPERADAAMLSVSGLQAGERMRIATLDDYDGVVYSVGGAAGPSASGTFARVPYAIEPSGSGRQASISVSVGAYGGVWVPDAGSLETIDFGGDRGPELQDSFYYNATSGTGAVVAQLRSGDNYDLDALIPAPVDDTQLTLLEPGSAPLPALGDLPDGLATTLTEYVGGADTPGARLVAMISALKANGYVSHGIGDEPFSRSGHSADRISELLDSQPMLGDAEQYAVTAALMARSLGYPARVVMGFVVPDATDGSDSVDITGADLSAWIEVNTSAAGWVAVDPNPAVREIPKAQDDEPTQVSRPQSVVQPPPADQPPADDPAPPDVTQSDQTDADPVWLTVLLLALRIAGFIAAAVAIIVAPFLGVIAAKWRRRRRRRTAAQPQLRAAGGWDEYADTAIDYGFEPAPHATRRELAGVIGGAAPARLAAEVDRITFSPDDSTADSADGIWSDVEELRESLGAGRTRWERLRAAISLRSFLARREARPPTLEDRRGAQESGACIIALPARLRRHAADDGSGLLVQPAAPDAGVSRFAPGSAALASAELESAEVGSAAEAPSAESYPAGNPSASPEAAGPGDGADGPSTGGIPAMPRASAGHAEAEGANGPAVGSRDAEDDDGPPASPVAPSLERDDE